MLPLLAFSFLLSFLFWPLVKSRGRPINLYDQPGNWHRGPGDIANLWVGFSGSDSAFRPGAGPVTRNAIKPNSQNRWTRYQNDRGQHIIPYIISGKFDSQEHATIARAMMAIAENTCIKFEKRGGEADYVDLKNERGEGCYTIVGRSAGKNTVMLETNEIATCLEFDIVIHELMHTIGLWHEQMRYDRDEFIKIHWENIGPAYVTQFEKVPDTDSTTYSVKYDYQSVMHYAKDAFASAPGKITMETLDRQFQDVIGKVRDASPSDYLKICNIYSCHTCMGRPFKTGQSSPVDGQRVVTLGPGPVTLPTASPSPATLPLGTTTTVAATTKSPNPSSLPSSTSSPAAGGPLKDSKEKEDRRVRPTPILPIILPLINNNWWWKNTPAPPLRDPHGRMLLLMRDDGTGTKGGNEEKEVGKEGGRGVEKPAKGKGEGNEGKEDEEEEWREVPENLEEKSSSSEEEDEEEDGDKEENKMERMKLKGRKKMGKNLEGNGEEKEEKEVEEEKAKRSKKKKEEDGEVKPKGREEETVEVVPKKEKPIEEQEKSRGKEEEEKQEGKGEKGEEELPEVRPKKECRDDAAFCARLFNGPDQQEWQRKSAVKACALGVIKRHCCRSCWGHGRRKGSDEERGNGDGEAGKKRRKWRKKANNPWSRHRVGRKEENEEEEAAVEGRGGETRH